MVDFICMGLLELWGLRVERKLQNEKFLPTVGFKPGIFREAWCLLYRVSPVLFFKEFYLLHVVDEAK